jgi:ATP-dependent DNA helicase RecQ
MNKYTANYSYSNHNFVIQNLTGQRIDNEYLPAICILKNILQRGRPTLLSEFLQEKIGAIHKTDEFGKPYPLIDNETPNWERIIRGDVKGNYFPAKKFFDELIPKYLSDYLFIQQLLIPEIPVNEITQIQVDKFANQQVDFYLPQAYLIIEIDGSQHDRNINQDKLSDQHTAKYGIQTIRIKTTDLEAENESFKKSITAIKERIDKVISRQEKRRQNNPIFISINDYKTAFENGVDLTSPYYTSTATIRFQILVLELLEKGILDFKKEWKFELHTSSGKDFAELAIQDLFHWLEPIFELHKIKWNKSKYSIKAVNSLQEFSNSPDTAKVDFSLPKRYTDEFQTYPNILFVRTDYLDEHFYFKNTNAINPTFVGFEPYDYFNVSSTKPVKYKLQFGGKDSDEKHLLFLLQNIFLQDVPNLTFNEGQLPIIANVLSRNDTIGLLPTGSGKSVCYQLAAILQPAISFVVCPIKSLMYDQKADLDLCRFTRVNHITSDDDGEDREKIQNEFGNGKYLFIFISPERFQIKTFREYFSAVNKKFNIAYAVIDEVHCLSEWGHDFRTAYLNLANTIQRLCSNFKFIALTATASLQVLKDIKLELGIKEQDDNVKTQINFTRPELDFEVINAKNDRLIAIKDLLSELNESKRILTSKGNESRCGIIFTPTVTGDQGCLPLSNALSEYFQTEIQFFSGKKPDNFVPPQGLTFEEYKIHLQREFKANQFTILTATKAFGMGVNKPNIHFTVHYGIPGSMEALYQEGGRAGRDKEKFAKEKAKCYVLFSKSTTDDQTLNQLWIRETPLSRLQQLQNRVNGDLNTNFFLFLNGLEIISKEFEIIKELHDRYSAPSEKKVRVEGREIGIKKAQAEKAIYRLRQLGIVEDWTIENFFGGGVFEVDYSDFNSNSIKNALLETINKYDPSFSIESINTESKYALYRRILNEAPNGYTDFDKFILLLLQWSYDNFANNRRQSLKHIYENCCDFSEGVIDKEEFKTRLENYFKFNQSSYILQHIAETPKDFEKWFEVFYQVENNLKTDKFLSRQQREALRDNLSRFLESYMYNPGLDLISGLLRLWLDDYENIDGRKRLESSLEEIQHFEESQIDFIVTQILRIGKELTNKNKNFLAESLYKFFNDESFLHRIQKELGDTFSMASIIENANKKLKTINKRIYGGLRKTG